MISLDEKPKTAYAKAPADLVHIAYYNFKQKPEEVTINYGSADGP